MSSTWTERWKLGADQLRALATALDHLDATQPMLTRWEADVTAPTEAWTTFDRTNTAGCPRPLVPMRQL